MTDRPAPTRFQALLESALQECQKKPGVILADSEASEDSLAIRLQRCHSIDDITTLLHDKTNAFNDFQQHDKILKSIKATVSILSPVSTVASIADDANLVRRKVTKVYLAFLTVYTELTPTHESDTFYSRYPIGRMCHSYVDT